MDKKLVIIFKDGYINIGKINVMGIGVLYSQDSVFRYLEDFKWIEVENGWVYNSEQISKIKDCTDAEIKSILRDININTILTNEILPKDLNSNDHQEKLNSELLKDTSSIEEKILRCKTSIKVCEEKIEVEGPNGNEFWIKFKKQLEFQLKKLVEEL